MAGEPCADLDSAVKYYEDQLPHRFSSYNTLIIPSIWHNIHKLHEVILEMHVTSYCCT